MKRKTQFHIAFFSAWGPQRRKTKLGIEAVASGFMLIELIVATLIASMIAGILLTALAQGNRSQLAIDNMIDVSERVSIVANQLEKDLMGAFIPAQAEKKDADKTPEKADEKSGDTQPKNPEKTGVAQKQKPIEKIFYSTNKEGMLDTLTFVTNNPLVVFVGKDVGEVKPKAVRVQYTVKAEPGKKGSYALFRQESMELDLAEYKNVRPYEVIGGIKKLSVNFTARIEKKDEKKAGEQTAKEKPKLSYEYKTMPEWVSEQKKDVNKQEDKDKPEFPRIPYKVEFALTLWDQQNKKDKEFTIVCEIPTDTTEPKEQEKRESAPAKKDEAKTAAPGGKTQQQVMQNKQVNSQEVVVLNGIETLTNTLSNLTKLLKQM